ncbi:AraC family transcriptional regulator [Streptomyces sp. NA04227]|uniref:AraC family transcriptional regulator n=1 Tax=Streptomyces sp. NA04227 TaxID=2742136 RepID=UPI00158FC12A|nr:AraC family transcriptional regulator [Streptomyces sp. NA04227]QKW05151.1 AraC family transcriptional regulator [Streptomyces sp. NA04227]
MESVAHYRTPPDGVRALGLAVTGAGRVRGQGTHRERRTLHEWAGVLVTAGTGRLTLHGRPGTHSVTAGTFFWLPPGVPHSYGPGPDGWDEHWVLFDGPAAPRYAELGYLDGGPAGPAVLAPADPADVRERLAELLGLLGGPETLAGHVTAAGALHCLIGAVGTGVGARAVTPGVELGLRALELLDRMEAGPIRVGRVARELAVSRDTLATAVRRVTGSTPTEYVTRRRLDRAKALLAGTGHPVSRIAREAGYPDPAYFTRVFTRHVGSSPTAFRRQQQVPLTDTGSAYGEESAGS